MLFFLILNIVTICIDFYCYDCIDFSPTIIFHENVNFRETNSRVGEWFRRSRVAARGGQDSCDWFYNDPSQSIRRASDICEIIIAVIFQL